MKEIFIPSNLEEAFEELDKIISPEDLRWFRNLPDPTQAHMNMGMALRNRWGLWQDSKLAQFFRTYGISHPDDMSHVILVVYHKRLNSSPDRPVIDIWNDYITGELK